MSSSNKHSSHKIHNHTSDYVNKELGLSKRCPRKQCKGTLISVLTQYKRQGPINQELECADCGKVIKDPRFKAERERRWQARQKYKQAHENK